MKMGALKVSPFCRKYLYILNIHIYNDTKNNLHVQLFLSYTVHVICTLFVLLIAAVFKELVYVWIFCFNGTWNLYVG